MDESNHRHSVVVGLFITIGLAIVVAAVVLIGEINRSLQSRIEIISYFEDVSGLQKGNFIWLKGVRVGTVKKVLLDDDHGVEVVMEVDSRVADNIYKDSGVKLGTDGLIGNKILIISGGSKESGHVSKGDIIRSEADLSIDKLLATLQISNENLLEITDNFRKISKNMVEGEGSVGKLLNDDSVYSNIDLAVQSLKDASGKANQLLNILAGYSRGLEKEGTLAYELTSDTAIFDSLKASVEKLNNIADSASLFITVVKNAGQNENTTLGAILNDENGGKNIKETIENLRISAKRLNEDLEGLQHTFPLKRYFRKKDNQNY